MKYVGLISVFIFLVSTFVGAYAATESGIKPLLVSKNVSAPVQLEKPMTVACNANMAIQKCIFKTPFAKRAKVFTPRTRYDGGRIRMSKRAREDPKVCEVHVEKVKSKDLGKWRCVIISESKKYKGKLEIAGKMFNVSETLPEQGASTTTTATTTTITTTTTTTVTTTTTTTTPTTTTTTTTTNTTTIVNIPSDPTTTSKCQPVTAMDGCNAKCPNGRIICQGKLKNTDFQFSSKKLSDSKYLTNWKVPEGDVGEHCSMYCPGQASFSIRCRRNLRSGIEIVKGAQWVGLARIRRTCRSYENVDWDLFF